jgi:tetratricopeptide (TPR) repeat protein
MLHPHRAGAALVLLLLAAPVAVAQVEVDTLPPTTVPLVPFSARQLAQREALYLFADGVLAEHQERLLDAVQAYEQSAKIDPDAAPVLRILVMLYLGLERYEDALVLSRRVLQLDPEDYQTSYLLARQLRARNQLKEACDVLCVGLRARMLDQRPDLRLQMENDLGIIYERLDRYADAAAAFNRAAGLLDHDDMLADRMTPQELQLRSAETHERAGRNHLEAEQYGEAIAAFRKAQEVYPGGAGRLHFNLAQVYTRQGKLEEAASALDNYLAILPQGTEAYDMKIAILERAGLQREILPWLEKASAKDQFNVGLKLMLAKQCVRLNQPARAEAIYSALASSSPTEDLYRDLFKFYLEQPGRGPEFVLALVNSTLENALRKENAPANNPAPAQARAMIVLLRGNAELSRPLVQTAARQAAQRRLTPDSWQLLAALADRQGMLPEAEILYGECIKGPLTPATEPLIYGSLLQILWKQEHYEAIIQTCRTGVKQAQPVNHGLLRADMARALGALQRWNEAIAEADRAVRDAQEGERFALRILRARILMQAGKLGEAETECLGMLEQYPMPGDKLEVHYLLSGIYTQARHWPQAEAALAACLKIDPFNPAASNDLAYIWAEQNKNLNEAEAMIRRAIEQDRKNRQGVLSLRPGADKEFRDNACYFDTLGWVLFRRGQMDEAKKELGYAATLPDGDDPVIWEHIGEVAAAQGDRTAAAEAWVKALDFYEHGKLRKMDEHYQALQRKLKQFQRQAP